MSVWVLQQQLSPEEEAQIEERPYLTLPFEDMPDLSPIANQAECRKLVRMLMPDAPPETITRKVDRIWGLYSSLHAEDLIAVPLATSQQIALAQVSGRYSHAADENGNDIHRIAISWYPKRVSMKAMKKHAEWFAPGGEPMREVTDKTARIALREHLPHSYNRFVRLKWLMGLLFAMGAIRAIEHMIRNF